MSYTKIYQQTQNNSANGPLESVAVLLDSAAKHVAQARQAIIQGEIERRFHETDKASAIIVGLVGNLSDDPKTDAAITLVKEMHDYYTQVILLLTDINMKNDPILCEKVIVILKSMADVWRHAAQKSKEEQGIVHTDHIQREI